MGPDNLHGIDAPPAPWRLGGSGHVAAFALDQELELPDGLSPLSPRTLVVVLNRYSRGTLSYDELAFCVPARQGALPVAWVSNIWVSSMESVAGGRRHFGLSKLLGDFRWSEQGCAISDEDGEIASFAFEDGRAWGFAPLVLPAVGRFTDERFFARGYGRVGLSTMRVRAWSLRWQFEPVGAGWGVTVPSFSVTFGKPHPARSARPPPRTLPGRMSEV